MKIVSIAALGICEHCGVVLSIQDMPAEAMDGVWACPNCRKALTNESFGYSKNGKKMHWVGPEGKWVDEEPSKRFQLGNFDVASAAEMRQMMTSSFSH